ncbi:MAG: hypothetical protein KDI30_10335 [Pseudomonadales bacterium]|nr:hypothetical protein [Pseudomonadales bacterium]
MNRFCKAVFLLLTCALLAACGWHLKGQHINPPIPHKIYLTSFDSYGETHLLLKKTLQRQNALSPTLADSDYHLEILNEDIETNTLSISDINNASEYEIVLSINYQINPKNGELARKQNLKTGRHYQFNRNRVVAKEREQKKLLEEMRNDLINQLVRQLGYLPAN